MKPANIYESDETKLNQEAERLSSFDLPNQVSINAIGEIRAETKFLDVGAGSNTVLGKYVSEHNGIYTALDKNQSFLDIQKAKGVITIHGDAREMPLSTNSFDISHVRFVIAHLGQDKENAIQETLRVTKQGGSAIFLDFDWTTAHGSKDFDNFRDFMINSGFLFDASFGAFLDTAVRLAITNDQASITAKRFSPELMFDKLGGTQIIRNDGHFGNWPMV